MKRHLKLPFPVSTLGNMRLNSVRPHIGTFATLVSNRTRTGLHFCKARSIEIGRVAWREPGRVIREQELEKFALLRRGLSAGVGEQAAAGRRVHDETNRRNKAIAIYMLAIVVGGVGISYSAVPLYKMFCQATGFGGTTRQVTMDTARKMVPVQGAKPIKVRFAASTSDTLPWKFRPQQKEVIVVPGETALAFYTAYNPTDEPITGVATYNITPLKAGLYFNKIQCFCFDQQRLRPREEVDMPVFFYIDPNFVNDPQMHGIDNIVLSYTFFRSDKPSKS